MAQPALRLGQSKGIPNVAEPKFVYRRAAEILGVSKIDQLGAAGSVCVKARNSGSSIRIRAIEEVVVIEVIRKDTAKTSVLIYANSAFVITELLCRCGTLEEVVSGIRFRNKLEELCCGGRPCRRWSR